MNWLFYFVILQMPQKLKIHEVVSLGLMVPFSKMNSFDLLAQVFYSCKNLLTLFEFFTSHCRNNAYSKGMCLWGLSTLKLVTFGSFGCKAQKQNHRIWYTVSFALHQAQIFFQTAPCVIFNIDLYFWLRWP